MRLCPIITRGDPLFRAVPGDAPAAGERLLGRPRIPTLAERSPRHIWVESTRCGEPAARNEGASGKTSTVTEISVTVRHGPPYCFVCGRSRVGQIQGVVVYLSTEFGLGEVLDRIGLHLLIAVYTVH